MKAPGPTVSGWASVNPSLDGSRGARPRHTNAITGQPPHHGPQRRHATEGESHGRREQDCLDVSHRPHRRHGPVPLHAVAAGVTDAHATAGGSQLPGDPPHGAPRGAITAIVFTKTFETRDPQDVFFYALGVPAVLIATVSNLSTISEAKHRATLARVEASNAILNVAPPPVEPMPLRQLTPSAPPGPSGHLLGPLAWAKAPEDRESLRLAGEDQYLVVIGTYTSEAAAWRALETLRRQRLNTELYIPKHLQVFQAGTNTYYVSYTAPLSREDAVKLYRLIQVNDPRLSPQILQQTNG
jgi:hypothetical protein